MKIGKIIRQKILKWLLKDGIPFPVKVGEGTVNIDGESITLPSLTSDPTLTAGKLWYRSDLGRLHLSVGTTKKTVFPAQWSDIINKPSAYPPSSHAVTHEPDGSDEITYLALTKALHSFYTTDEKAVVTTDKVVDMATLSHNQETVLHMAQLNPDSSILMAEWNLDRIILEGCELRVHSDGITDKDYIYDWDTGRSTYATPGTDLDAHEDREVIVWDLGEKKDIVLHVKHDGGASEPSYIEISDDDVNYTTISSVLGEVEDVIKVSCRYIRWRVYNDNSYSRTKTAWKLYVLYAFPQSLFKTGIYRLRRYYIGPKTYYVYAVNPDGNEVYYFRQIATLL